MLSIDLYINETTRHADLILPSTSSLENDHYDSTFNLLAVRNVTRFNRAILAKPDGALHDWEIFVGLAQAFARRAELELKPTWAPAQMIDLALRKGAMVKQRLGVFHWQRWTSTHTALTSGRYAATSLRAWRLPARLSKRHPRCCWTTFTA